MEIVIKFVFKNNSIFYKEIYHTI